MAFAHSGLVEVRQEFMDALKNLTRSKSSIQRAAGMLVSYVPRKNYSDFVSRRVRCSHVACRDRVLRSEPNHLSGLLKVWEEEIVQNNDQSSASSKERTLHLIYVANEALQRAKNTERYDVREAFEGVAFGTFQHIYEVGDNGLTKKLKRVLSAWKERKIIDATLIGQLEDLLGVTSSSVLAKRPQTAKEHEHDKAVAGSTSSFARQDTEHVDLIPEAQRVVDVIRSIDAESLSLGLHGEDAEALKERLRQFEDSPVASHSIEKTRGNVDNEDTKDKNENGDDEDEHKEDGEEETVMIDIAESRDVANKWKDNISFTLERHRELIELLRDLEKNLPYASINERKLNEDSEYRAWCDALKRVSRLYEKLQTKKAEKKREEERRKRKQREKEVRDARRRKREEEERLKRQRITRQSAQMNHPYLMGVSMPSAHSFNNNPTYGQARSRMPYGMRDTRTLQGNGGMLQGRQQQHVHASRRGVGRGREQTLPAWMKRS